MLGPAEWATRESRTPALGGLRRLVDYSLPACMLFTLAMITAGMDTAAWPARLTLLVYLASQWRQLNRLAKALLTVGLVLAIVVAYWRADAALLLAQALDRFCFFATFVAALGMLRIAAMHSRLIRQAGQVLIHQRPARRYPILAMGSGLFGIIVNIGVLNLFGTLIKRSNSLRAAGGNETIHAIRERRMMLAMLRGFSLIPLISPLSVSVAVILSNMTDLSWIDLAPAALPTGALMFVFGWLFDWLQQPHQSGVAAPELDPPSLVPFLRFLLLATAITLSVFAVAGIFELALPVAVLIACPVSAFIWLAMQRRRLSGGSGTRRAALLLARHPRTIFGANRIEIALMGGSGFLGALIAPLVNTDRLGDILLASGLHGPAAAVSVMVLVVLLAQIGLSPIVTATLIIGVLPAPTTIDLHPVVLACALMSAWSLTMLSSPITAVMVILSRLTGRSIYTIIWRWDGLFFVFMLFLLSAWLWLLTGMF